MKAFARRNAKAIAALFAAATFFFLTDGKDSSELEEALAAVSNAAIVWVVSNREV